MSLPLFGLFIAVLGSKLLLISIFGSAVPFWDQWDAEPGIIYTPYFEGRLSAELLFSLHNEHRIFFSRLIMLAALLLSGEWNPLLQVIVNAALHALAVVTLTWAFTRVVPNEYRGSMILLSAIVFCLPFAYENLLAGFQSQFYFQMLFGSLCLIIVSGLWPISPLWGLAAALASFFSLSSGVFVFLSAAGVIAIRSASTRTLNWRDTFYAATFIIAGLTCLMFVTSPSHHGVLKAKTVLAFITPAAWLSGFPFTTVLGADTSPVATIPVAVAAIAPVALLAVLAFLKRSASPATLFTLGIAFLTAMQIVSISINRAVGFTAPRYFDLLLLLVPASYAALILLNASRRILAGWSLVCVACLVYLGVTSSLDGIKRHKYLSDRQVENVRAFIATGDPSALRNKPRMEIPYPDSERLAMLLSTPMVRALLPTELRPSDPETIALRARLFPRQRLYDFVRKFRTNVLASSSWVFAVGVGLLFASALCSPRRKQP